MEFIAILEPKMNDKHDFLEKAYRKKYEECVTKANIFFPGDKDFALLLKSVNEKTAQKKRPQKIRRIIILGVVIVLAAIIGINSIPTVSNDSDKCNEAVMSAISKGELAKAKNYIVAYEGPGFFKEFFLGSSDNISVSAVRLINAYLKKKDLNNAKLVASQAGFEFNSSWTPKREVAAALYKGCIELEVFSEAWNVVLTGDEEKYGGTYIKDVCTHLCKKGRKKQAYSFVKQNEDKIHEYSDGSGTPDILVNGSGKKRSDVVKYLNNYIKNF